MGEEEEEDDDEDNEDDEQEEEEGTNYKIFKNFYLLSHLGFFLNIQLIHVLLYNV